MVAGTQYEIKKLQLSKQSKHNLERIHRVPLQRQNVQKLLEIQKKSSSFLQDQELALQGNRGGGEVLSPGRYGLGGEAYGPRHSPPEMSPGCSALRPTQARHPLDFPCPPGHKEPTGLISFSPHIHLFLQKERTEQEMPSPECFLGGREETAGRSSPPPRPPLWFPGGAQGPGPAAAGLTLQRECVRCRGELMSLGVDDRSPSAADASEMTEGCREWQGLTLTAGKQGQLVSGGWRECPCLH